MATDRSKLWRVAWEVAMVLLVLAMTSYTWMFGDISSPNERSRVYLAVAMVEDHTVQIDAPIARWGKIYDLAERDGHYYSDKAPGSSILGAGVYFVASQFKPLPEWRIRDLINLMRTWLMLPITLLGFVLLRRIIHNLGLDPPIADIVGLGWILGTAAFHYGAAYFGHQIVAVALLAALYCVLQAEEALGQPRLIAKWCLGAGIAAGIAGLTEYQAGVPCVLLVLYVALGDARLRNFGVPALLFGAMPFVLLLLAYNDAAFGGPLQLSYHHLASEELRELHGQGIAGVTIPQWDYFWGSMLSLHRGLFVCSPMFVLSLWGLWLMWDDGDRRLAMLIGGTLLYFVAFVSSSNMWFAGWGFGPRLLVPGMALWSIAAAYAVQATFRVPITEGFARGVIAVQIAYTQAVVVYFPEPPEHAENPLLDVVATMRAADLVSPNWGQTLLGLSPPSSIFPIAALTVFAILVVMFSGTRPLRWSSRFIILGATLACFLVGAAIVSGAGASWDDAPAKRWVEHVTRWQARE